MQNACVIIILSGVTFLAVPHSNILSHKGHIFQKKGTEHHLCVLIFYISFAQNISHSKKTSVSHYHRYIYSSTPKVPVILLRF
jgi:uncharacterized membrane protein SirB2